MLRPLVCLLAAVACTASTAQGQAAPARPRTLQVPTAPGVSLEVIDWGGGGRPLVFLPGGGLSAREFDEFAPPLADEYRVLGISRRGSGASSDVPPDSLDELVDDIVAVLDSLRLRSAVLVGHSFAGVEMALFGEKHPDRCAGLIYLDAAYDYADPDAERVFTQAPPPPPPPMTAADSASFEAVRAYGERINGFRMPDSEIRRLHRWEPGGRMVERLVSETQKRLGALVRTPRWEAIQCPSLGMYPVPAPLETWLDWYHALTPDQRVAGEAYVREFGRWTAAQRAKFGGVPRNRVVEFPTGNHYFFLEMPDEARRAIREFVSSLPRAGPAAGFVAVCAENPLLRRGMKLHIGHSRRTAGESGAPRADAPRTPGCQRARHGHRAAPARQHRRENESRAEDFTSPRLRTCRKSVAPSEKSTLPCCPPAAVRRTQARAFRELLRDAPDVPVQVVHLAGTGPGYDDVPTPAVMAVLPEAVQ